jgi:hypothetical protein
MVGPERLFVDLQCALQERLGLGMTALLEQFDCSLIQSCRFIEVLRSRSLRCEPDGEQDHRGYDGQLSYLAYAAHEWEPAPEAHFQAIVPQSNAAANRALIQISGPVPQGYGSPIF